MKNNAIFEETMENVKNRRYIKLRTTKARRNYLVTKPTYHTRKVFSDNLLVIEIKGTQMLINKQVYLGISILEISK